MSSHTSGPFVRCAARATISVIATACLRCCQAQELIPLAGACRPCGFEEDGQAAAQGGHGESDAMKQMMIHLHSESSCPSISLVALSRASKMVSRLEPSS